MSPKRLAIPSEHADWSVRAEHTEIRELREIPNRRFNPTFDSRSLTVVPHPLAIVSVANQRLGERVGTLAEEGDAIVAALDGLFTRASGRWRPCAACGRLERDIREAAVNIPVGRSGR